MKGQKRYVSPPDTALQKPWEDRQALSVINDLKVKNSPPLHMASVSLLGGGFDLVELLKHG